MERDIFNFMISETSLQILTCFSRSSLTIWLQVFDGPSVLTWLELSFHGIGFSFHFSLVTHQFSVVLPISDHETHTTEHHM